MTRPERQKDTQNVSRPARPRRLEVLAAESPSQRARTEALIALAERGLPMMHSDGRFAHTMRAIAGDQSRGARPEGDSLRYATNVALGLHYIPESRQRAILGGQTAAELALATAQRGEASDDAGAIALAAWAAAEAAGTFAAPLFETLTRIIRSHEPVETVSCAWALIAALAARDLGETEALVEAAAQRLLEAQSPSGLFPHMLPSSSYGRLRAHIGCFADQVYATQGLARLSVARGRREVLAAAEACAARICALQGPAGQWWWHYDTRNGSVVEGYPVYSVHQHAMGPMALLDVLDAGGTNHIDAIARGLRWLDSHPEVTGEIVDEEHCLIWRKAARREPANKSVRAVSAFTTALKPGLHLPLIDTLCPPGRIDYECRPYEFGWMLYAWLSDGAVQRLAHPHAVEN